MPNLNTQGFTEDHETYICCQCGFPLLHSQFYKSTSGFYVGSGHLPICKTCFEQKFNMYYDEYGSSRLALKRLCMSFDIYFSDDIFDSCPDDDTLLGTYFRKLNMKQYKGRTFDYTLQKGFSFADEYDPETVKAMKKKKEEELKAEVSEDDIEKWGGGLDPIDYENLNSHYKYLKSANKNCDSNQEIFINDLCYTKMQQLKCVRNGDMDSFKKMGEYYNSTFGKSGLKVSREAEANADDCLGVWVSRISQYTPEEYYLDKELYSDHDGLGSYIKRFLLRPLQNLMLGTQDRDEEYCVRDDAEDDELSEVDIDEE